MYKPFKIANKLEIVKNGACFLDARRIELLRLVQDRGSILAASKEMRMSYQQAWYIISDLNAAAPLPVVVRQRGGANGGGASITNYGRRLLSCYSDMNRRLEEYIASLDNDLQEMCRF